MVYTAEKEIDWLSPNQNQEITLDDFRSMVRKAEMEKGMSLSEYKAKMNVWWQNHL